MVKSPIIFMNFLSNSTINSRIEIGTYVTIWNSSNSNQLLSTNRLKNTQISASARMKQKKQLKAKHSHRNITNFNENRSYNDYHKKTKTFNVLHQKLHRQNYVLIIHSFVLTCIYMYVNIKYDIIY